MKKQNSQSRRGRKKETDPIKLHYRAIRKEFSYIRYYYPRAMVNKIEKINDFLQREAKKATYRWEVIRMLQTVKEMKIVMDHVFKNKMETGEYIQCLKIKLKHIMSFLNDLGKYDYNIWWYLDNEGANNPLLPNEMEIYASSDKVYEIIFGGFTDVMNKCLKHV